MVTLSRNEKLSVRLSGETLMAVLSHRSTPKESVDDIIGRLAFRGQTQATSAENRPQSPRKIAGHVGQGPTRYVCEALGTRITGASLSSLFAAVVDVISDRDPTVVEKLSHVRARKRGFVARSATGIHPDRSDLKVLRTQLGWYVDGNVSREQVNKALKELGKLCRQSGLGHVGEVEG